MNATRLGKADDSKGANSFHDGAAGAPVPLGPVKPAPIARKLAGAARDQEVTAMVEAAKSGDREAWDALFNSYVSLLWSIALRHGLRESDAADVVQSTWLRLLEHIDDIRDSARIGAWLATTAQRESLRCVAQRRRIVLSDDDEVFDGPDRLLAPVDEALLAREQAGVALAALAALPPSWRELLERLTQDPPLSYEDIGADLGVPVGSIGPTRGRCVRRMRAAIVESY
jgi:RNA polymerase sigma factor (sigma-70 family)